MTKRGRADAPGLTSFGTWLLPGDALQPILARPVREALTAWLTEIWAEEELKAANLTPRRRALFDGPPGVGKTTLAHHLAARLGLPLLAVRPETIVDCWLGSTGRNIGALFDMATDQAEPFMLFFDEFDAIAIARRRAERGAEDERNSWVNVLLQHIDSFGGFLVAATNNGSHIDQAIWRRFDIQIALELPGAEERGRIVARYLQPYGLPASSLAALSAALETATPSLIKQFCESLKRTLVIGHKVGWDMSLPAVINRTIGSVSPHPDIGKPRLWSLGVMDPAVLAMPWPLPMAGEASEEREPDAGVVQFRGVRR